MKYSLADYKMTITPNDPVIRAMFNELTIGGEGNALESIQVERTESQWTTESFATGAYVHNKNLSKVGTADVSLSQLSKYINKFTKLCESYFSAASEGLTISVSGPEGQVCSCIDCYPTKIPAQMMRAKSGTQTWSFTCGEINFN